MKELKNVIGRISLAATVLFGCQIGQMGIITLVKNITGWKIPKSAARIIAATGATAAIILAFASCGYAVPMVVVNICKSVGVASA